MLYNFAQTFQSDFMSLEETKKSWIRINIDFPGIFQGKKVWVETISFVR